MNNTHQELPDNDVDRLLAELGSAEPPAQFRRNVMKQIAPQAGRVLTMSAVHRTAGGPMKKVLIGLSLAAALILGVMSITGYPPMLGTEGTIGAAKRYNAGQMADADVKLGDTSAQAFLQSDAFARLIKDPSAVKLLMSGQLSTALADAHVRDLLTDSQFREGLTDSAFRDALTSEGLQDAIHDAQVMEAFADANVAEALTHEAFRELLADLALVGKNGLQGGFQKLELQLTGLAQSGNLTAAAVASELHDLGFSASDIAALHLDAAFADKSALAAFQSSELQGALSGLSLALTDSAFSHGFASATFLHFLGSADAQAALSSPGVQTALAQGGALQSALADNVALAALSSEALSQALDLNGFAAALSSGALSQALQGNLKE